MERPPNVSSLLLVVYDASYPADGSAFALPCSKRSRMPSTRNDRPPQGSWLRKLAAVWHRGLATRGTTIYRARAIELPPSLMAPLHFACKAKCDDHSRKHLARLEATSVSGNGDGRPHALSLSHAPVSVLGARDGNCTPSTRTWQTLTAQTPMVSDGLHRWR
jgi:hypothetical protein